MRALYTIDTETAQVRYAGNDATTVFPVTFQFFEPTTLRVRSTVGDVVTLLVLNVDYTVSGGDGQTGSITVTPAPASGTNIIIDLDIPILQQTIDLSPNGPLPAEDVEQGFDRIVTMVKQLRQQLRATPELDATFNPDTDQPPVLPPPSAGKVLIGREDEAGWENADAFAAGTDLPVVATALANRDLLEYDAVSQVWRNRTRSYVLGDPLLKSGGTMTGPLTMSGTAFYSAARVDVASAATTAVASLSSNYVRITGTTTITSLNGIPPGAGRTSRVLFAGSLTLTNSASLILLGGADILTAAGDTAEFVYEGSSVWRCLWYQKANGFCLVSSSLTASLGANVTMPATGTIYTGPQVAQGTVGTWQVTGGVTFRNAAGGDTLDVVLWDGTSFIDSARVISSTVGGAIFLVRVTLSGIITNPAGNLRVSARAIARTDNTMAYNATGFGKDCTISATRLA